jgi:tetratricopeptide (TPR) repeat protein
MSGGFAAGLRRRPRLLGALLFLVVLAVFLPVTRHEFICYDDNGYVTTNGWVREGLTWANIGRAFRTTEIAYWHPLTWLSHLADAQLYGLNPAGHHLTSALLHAVNALLVFVVLRKLTGAAGCSWFVAALFGLHPLHVESVAWVAERKDVLSTLWWLVTLWCYAHWIEQPAARRARARVFHGLALLSFGAALMSKPMVVTLPCVLLLLDYWPLQRWSSAAAVGRLFVEKLPFFGLAVVAGIFTIRAQASLGSVQSLTFYPWFLRGGNALLSYAGYLGKCFVPANLAVFYPYPTKIPAGPELLAALLLAGITVAVVAWRSRAPYLLVGWLFYLGTLVPVIGLVQVGEQAMADRYTYVPLLGIFIMLAWGAAGATQGRAHRSFVLGAAAALLLGASALLTLRQLRFWQDSPTLFHHALDVTENNWLAHQGLGYYYAQPPGDLSEAIAEYRAMLKIVPQYAEAHFSLAAVLARRPESLAEAVAEYQTALRINPRHAAAASALGKAWLQIPGRLGEAAAAFETAVRLAPADPDVRNDLADVLARLPERLPEAVAAYREVLRLRPDWVEVHSNLGLVLARMPGRLSEALAEYETVLRARPDFAAAHNNLANALIRLPGRTAAALAEYETAVRLQPANYQARFNLALLLSDLPGRTPEAIVQFEAVLQLKPDLAAAREMLERLRASPRP